jgi:hypothetical protein
MRIARLGPAGDRRRATILLAGGPSLIGGTWRRCGSWSPGTRRWHPSAGATTGHCTAPAAVCPGYLPRGKWSSVYWRAGASTAVSARRRVDPKHAGSGSPAPLRRLIRDTDGCALRGQALGVSGRRGTPPGAGSSCRGGRPRSSRPPGPGGPRGGLKPSPLPPLLLHVLDPTGDSFQAARPIRLPGRLPRHGDDLGGPTAPSMRVAGASNGEGSPPNAAGLLGRSVRVELAIARRTMPSC